MVRFTYSRTVIFNSFVKWPEGTLPHWSGWEAPRTCSATPMAWAFWAFAGWSTQPGQPTMGMPTDKDLARWDWVTFTSATAKMWWFIRFPLTTKFDHETSKHYQAQVITNVMPLNRHVAWKAYMKQTPESFWAIPCGPKNVTGTGSNGGLGHKIGGFANE